MSSGLRQPTAGFLKLNKLPRQQIRELLFSDVDS
jgi:hypothetical protein